jgi:hypothetical protein
MKTVDRRTDTTSFLLLKVRGVDSSNVLWSGDLPLSPRTSNEPEFIFSVYMQFEIKIRLELGTCRIPTTFCVLSMTVFLKLCLTVRMLEKFFFL